MPLSKQQTFKYGFLLYCAENGLSLSETHQLVKNAIVQIQDSKMTKQANPLLAALLSGGVAAGKTITDLGTKGLSMLPGLASTGAAIGIGAPLAAGAGTGYLAAKLTNSNKADALEEVKQDEILDEYERLTDEAKRRAMIKRIQAQTGRRITPLSPSLGV